MTKKSDKERLVRRDFKGKILRTLGRVPFAEQAAAAYCCAIDDKTPTHVKATIIGALAYFIAPIDAIPDFLLALGYTDDAAVFWMAWRSIASHITEEHRDAARRFLDDLKSQ